MDSNNTLFTIEGMTDEELFSRVSHDDLESEKITAPRYSYWRSVFRVFFRKKINIIILGVLLFVILFTYIYPAIFPYDRFGNLMNASAKHLSPARALEYFGSSIHWILGSGAVRPFKIALRWGRTAAIVTLLPLTAQRSARPGYEQ